MLHLQTRAARQIVEQAYGQVIRRKFPQVPVYFRVSIPEGSKTEQNAVKLLNLSHKLKKNMVELVSDLLENFPQDWCQKVCHKDWPPITFILSEKNVARLHKPVEKVIVTQSNVDKLVDNYLDILESMPIGDAIKCVEAGWPEGSAKVRAELIRKLKCQKALAVA